MWVFREHDITLLIPDFLVRKIVIPDVLAIDFKVYDLP